LIPFSYPKSRHTRRLRPGPFKKYSEYKPFLREEFEKKCVYCRMPDTMKDYEMYGVDHYRPKSLFSELLTTYANLFYCCNPCNRRKREYSDASCPLSIAVDKLSDASRPLSIAVRKLSDVSHPHSDASCPLSITVDKLSDASCPLSITVDKLSDASCPLSITVDKLSDASSRRSTPTDNVTDASDQSVRFQRGRWKALQDHRGDTCSRGMVRSC
jgi:hypothetical protein